MAPDPKGLGKVLTDLHQKPGQLRDILGGGGVQPQQQPQGSNPIIDTEYLPRPCSRASPPVFSNASRRVRPELRRIAPMSGILLYCHPLISSRRKDGYVRRRYDIAPKHHSSGWCGGPLSSVVR